MAKSAKAKTTTKSPAKKPAVKRAAAKKTKAAAEPQFTEVRFTQQTIYWMIFGAASVIFALWLYTLDARIRDLYDQIDANSYSTVEPMPQNKKPQE